MRHGILSSRVTQIAAIVGATLICAFGKVNAAPEPARSADDFVDRIGFASHLGYTDTPYGYAYDQVKKLMGEK